MLLSGYTTPGESELTSLVPPPNALTWVARAAGGLWALTENVLPTHPAFSMEASPSHKYIPPHATPGCLACPAHATHQGQSQVAVTQTCLHSNLAPESF